MKTAISIPDSDFERFEHLAARERLNRSEFYRQAAARWADQLEGVSELTLIANSVIEQHGQPIDAAFAETSAARVFAGTEQ